MATAFGKNQRVELPDGRKGTVLAVSGQAGKVFVSPDKGNPVGWIETGKLKELKGKKKRKK